MGQGKDDKQAINGYCRTNHKGFEAHIHFLLLEHDLNFPAMGVMRKNFPIRKAEIRANEHAERVWQNNMCKHYSAENRYRIKKCLNLLEYKSFQHNICMRSTKCEYRYYAGKC